MIPENRWLKIFLCLNLFRWTIITERLLCQVITGHGIGPSPTATADIEVLTPAATAFVSFKITQFLE